MVSREDSFLERARMIAEEYRDIFLDLDESRSGMYDWMVLIFSEIILLRNEMRDYFRIYKGIDDYSE